MPLAASLNRRVRVRRDEDSDVEVSDVYEDESSHTLSGDEAESFDGEEDEEEEEEEDYDDDEDLTSESGSEPENIDATLKSISFGALAKAQESLGPQHLRRKRKYSSGTQDEYGSGSSSEDDDGASKRRKKSSGAVDEMHASIRAKREEKEDKMKTKKKKGQEEDNDREMKDGKKERKKEIPHRSSKHAPQVLSSKTPVSRKRVVVEALPAAKARDPRFDSLVLASSSAGRGRDSAAQAAAQNYAFLKEYREKEITELRTQMAKTKNAEEKERLKRTLTSMLDRQRAFERKEAEREVLARHKRRERELLREGKKSKPYFLKRSEVRKQVLKEKWEKMKGSERKKAIERRRKKLAARERKDMPPTRRVVGQ
ncbi:hypothetical protein VTO42DRAFT_4698 [Malbranchea cinnamomea]